MKEIFANDKEVHSMILEVPEFVNTKRNDCILSKKYTKEKEGLNMKRLNKKMERVNNTILAVVLAGIFFFLLGDGLFGHLGGLIVTIIVTILVSLLYIKKLQLKNKKLQLKLIKARH